MPPIHLTELEWLEIDPSFRTLVDETPHVAAYDDFAGDLRLFPVELIAPVELTHLVPA